MSSRNHESIKTRIFKVYSWLKSHQTAVFVVTLLCCILLAFASVTTDKIEVGPFTVPHAYEDRGYTSQAISSAVVNMIRGNASKIGFDTKDTFAEDSESQFEEFAGDDEALAEIAGSKVETSFETSIADDIQVPLTSWTFSKLQDFLRELIGRNVTRVTGQIVFQEEDGTRKTDRRPVLIRYVIEYPEPARPILGYHWWSRQVTNSPDELPVNGAEEVIRKLAYITAACVNERTLVHEMPGERAARYIARGNAYAGLSNFDRAARMYEHANSLFNSARAHVGLGLIAEHDRDYETAEQEYLTALKLTGEGNEEDVVWAKLYLANLCARRKKSRESVVRSYDWLRALEAGDPNLHSASLATADGLNNLGFYYLTLHEWDAAQSRFHKSQELSEKLRRIARLCAYSDGHQNECGQLKGTEDPQRMKTRALLYIDLTNNQLSRSFYGMGEVHRQLRHFEEAQQSYHQAIHSNPKHWRSHQRLDTVLAEEKRLQGIKTPVRGSRQS